MIETIIKGGIIVALLAGLAFLTQTFIVDTAWFQGAFDVVFPAVFALKTIPIIDTFMDILAWTIVFETVFFTMNQVLRLLEWINITGPSFLKD